MEIISSSESIKRLMLNPNQIITLNDYPVYNEDVLKGYFRMHEKGIELPPVPVISRSIVEKYLPRDLFEQFLETHPEADYFMLDGSHRTTVETLKGELISAIPINSDEDIKRARELLERGELFGLTIGDTLKKCVDNLVVHFAGKPQFQTVLEKTERMVAEKVIPKYMIANYLARGRRS